VIIKFLVTRRRVIRCKFTDSLVKSFLFIMKINEWPYTHLRKRRQNSLKCLCHSNGLHGVTFRKTVIFIVTVVRNSNLTRVMMIVQEKLQIQCLRPEIRNFIFKAALRNQNPTPPPRSYFYVLWEFSKASNVCFSNTIKKNGKSDLVKFSGRMECHVK
jgi:hypothetical protein